PDGPRRLDAERDRYEPEDDTGEGDRELAVVLDQLRTVGPAHRLLGGDRSSELPERQLLRVALSLPEPGKRLSQVEVDIVGLEVGLVFRAAPGVGGVNGSLEEAQGHRLRPVIRDHEARPR